jgi:hypothetical protein
LLDREAMAALAVHFSMTTRIDDRMFLPAGQRTFVMHVDPISYAFQIVESVDPIRSFLRQDLQVSSTVEQASEVYFDDAERSLHRSGQSVRLVHTPGRSTALVNLGWNGSSATIPRETCVYRHVLPDANGDAQRKLVAHLNKLGFEAIDALRKHTESFVVAPRVAVTRCECERLTDVSLPRRTLHVDAGYSVSIDEALAEGAAASATLEIEFSQPHAADATALAAALRRRFGAGLVPIVRDPVDRLLRGREASPSERSSAARTRSASGPL